MNESDENPATLLAVANQVQDEVIRHLQALSSHADDNPFMFESEVQSEVLPKITMANELCHQVLDSRETEVHAGAELLLSRGTFLGARVAGAIFDALGKYPLVEQVSTKRAQYLALSANLEAVSLLFHRDTASLFNVALDLERVGQTPKARGLLREIERRFPGGDDAIRAARRRLEMGGGETEPLGFPGGGEGWAELLERHPAYARAPETHRRMLHRAHVEARDPVFARDVLYLSAGLRAAATGLLGTFETTGPIIRYILSNREAVEFTQRLVERAEPATSDSLLLEPALFLVEQSPHNPDAFATLLGRMGTPERQIRLIEAYLTTASPEDSARAYVAAAERLTAGSLEVWTQRLLPLVKDALTMEAPTPSLEIWVKTALLLHPEPSWLVSRVAACPLPTPTLLRHAYSSGSLALKNAIVERALHEMSPETSEKTVLETLQYIDLNPESSGNRIGALLDAIDRRGQPWSLVGALELYTTLKSAGPENLIRVAGLLEAALDRAPQPHDILRALRLLRLHDIDATTRASEAIERALESEELLPTLVELTYEVCNVGEETWLDRIVVSRLRRATESGNRPLRRAARKLLVDQFPEAAPKRTFRSLFGA